MPCNMTGDILLDSQSSKSLGLFSFRDRPNGRRKRQGGMEDEGLDGNRLCSTLS